MLGSASCQNHPSIEREGGTIIQFKYIDSKQDAQTILGIIKRRLSHIPVNATISYDAKNQTFTTSLPMFECFDTNLLMSNGEVFITTPLEKNPNDLLIEAISQSKQDTIWSYRYLESRSNYWRANRQQSSSPFLFLQKNIESVDSILNQTNIRELLPEDLKFIWNRNIPENKNQDTNSLINSERPESFYLEFTRLSDHSMMLNNSLDSLKTEREYEIQISLTFKLNEVATKNFAYLSEKYIGKELPIIIDNYLFLSPLINMPVTNGNITLSGLGNKVNQYLVMDAILQTKETIDGRLHVISCEYIPKPND